MEFQDHERDTETSRNSRCKNTSKSLRLVVILLRTVKSVGDRTTFNGMQERLPPSIIRYVINEKRGVKDDNLSVFSSSKGTTSIYTDENRFL